MYLIIGANGFLGSYLMKNILSTTNEQIIATSDKIEDHYHNKRVEIFKCNITNFNDLQALNEKIKKYENCKVFYLAAYHNPDLVAKNPKLAWNINIIALATALNTLDNIQCLFYPSTDTVYGDGNVDVHFKEVDELVPVNLYGKHKVLAEHIVNTYGYNVVRFPFLIGPSLSPNKKHFYDQIVETIKNGHPIEMYEDSYRSSLDFDTASKLLLSLSEKYNLTIPKILNISGDQDLSKYDVGLMIADKYGVSRSLIIPISVENNSKIFNEKRAKSALLDNHMIKKVLNLNEIKIKI